MTDTTQETVTPDTESDESTESDTDSTGIPDKVVEIPENVATLEKLDEMRQEFVAETAENINTYNSLMNEKAQKFGEFGDAAAGIYENSDDETLVKARAALEKLEAQKAQILKAQEEKAREIFEASKSGSEEEEKSLVARIAEAEEAYKAGQTYLKKWLGQKDYDITKSLEVLLPTVVGSKATSGDGRGSGIPKLRGFEVLVDGTPATTTKPDGTKVSSFSAAGTRMGVAAKDVQAAYFAEIGTTEKEKFPPEATFTVSNGEKSYTVTARKLADA